MSAQTTALRGRTIRAATDRVTACLDYETEPNRMSKADALRTLDAVLDHIRSSIDALLDEIKQDAEDGLP